MSLRDRMARDLSRLVGKLPVFCGLSAETQTIPCAWLSQRDEVRFSAVGLLGEDSVQIIVAQADMPEPPAFNKVLWVSGHRYRVSSVDPIDCISYRITLSRSDR